MKFPAKPGVYLFLDRAQKVIYVGKAKSLKDRISSYFQVPQSSDKTRALMRQYKKIEFIVCASELEALLLERKLIKKYRPRYNVSWKDDKNYPYLKLSMDEEWPRLIMVRKKKEDKALYFGPYESRSVKDSIRLIKKLFPIRWCKESPLKKRQQPCLHYHLKHCLAPCVGKISNEEYRNFCRAIASLLEGELKQSIDWLKKEMGSASAKKKFEEAAKLRDRIRNLSRMLQRKPGWVPLRRTKEGDTSLFELRDALGIRKVPHRIEAFDVSNIQGEDTVASMVTFEEGAPKKSHYRKFIIRTVTIPNDVKAIFEVVLRRYTKTLRKELPNPDLVLVDGGLAQVSSAKKALLKARLKNIPIIGLAKKEELIFIKDKKSPLKLPKDSRALQLLQSLRDEAHRFAISFHRRLARRSRLA